MSGMNISVDSLMSQYRDDIKVIITECHFSGKDYLDTKRLNLRLKELHTFALYEGLSEDEWYDLVYELTPEIYDQLTFGKIDFEAA